MATWVACIVETKGRPDFWDVARKRGVRPSTDAIPAYALIDCDSGFDFLASTRLAEALSRDLSAVAIGFVVQTTSDVHLTHVYASGECVRRLEYNRDDGGWGLVQGAPQAWEPAYFFAMPTDELSDEERARCAAAERAGDASSVVELLYPTSTAPMWAVCESLGIKEGQPDGAWKKPSLWSRLFGSA